MKAAGPILQTVGWLVLAIGGLTVLDRFLAKTEENEVEESAAAAYRLGTQSLQQGKPDLAVEPLRKAWVMDRDNPQYELQLAAALAATGKPDEAAPLIDNALATEPNDGPANLAAAHLMLRQKKSSEAKSFYHRAIYGAWKADGASAAIRARLELVKLLAQENDRSGMLSELISLEDQTRGDANLQKQVAQYFLMAGSPNRASQVYESLTASNPADAESFVGLGQAELELGNYRAARGAFLKASLRGSDPSIQPRLKLVETLTELDPTPRQLPSIEKYRRSRQLLEMTRADLAQTAESNPPKESDETNSLLQRADEKLSQKPPAHVTNESAEDLLTLAGDIWKARAHRPGTENQQDEVLRLLFERIAP